MLDARDFRHIEEYVSAMEGSWLSFLHGLNQSLRIILYYPDFYNFEPNTRQKLLPLRDCTLHSSKYCHHVDIEQGRYKGAASIRNDPVVNENSGVAWFHGCDGVLEYFDAFFVRPIVTDRAKIVCFGT